MSEVVRTEDHVTGIDHSFLDGTITDLITLGHGPFKAQ
jgi:hypothetical protein